MLLMIPFALNQPHHADGYAMPAASFKQLSRMAISGYFKSPLTTLEIRVLKRLSFPTAWVKCGLGDYAASDYGMTADSNPSLKMKPCC